MPKVHTRSYTFIHVDDDEATKLDGCPAAAAAAAASAAASGIKNYVRRALFVEVKDRRGRHEDPAQNKRRHSSRDKVAGGVSGGNSSYDCE